MNEVKGGWRKLHNEELHNLYYTPNIRVIKSRRVRWVGHVARTGQMWNVYKILICKSEGRTIWRFRRGWENNIIMNVTEIRFWDVDWIHMAHDRGRWQLLRTGFYKTYWISWLAERNNSFSRVTLLCGVSGSIRYCINAQVSVYVNNVLVSVFVSARRMRKLRKSKLNINWVIIISSSNLCPDRFWGPPSLLYNRYRGSFPRGVTLTTHPHLVPRSRMSRNHTFSPPKRLAGV
jgi:hypothetical protein